MNNSNNRLMSKHVTNSNLIKAPVFNSSTHYEVGTDPSIVPYMRETAARFKSKFSSMA